ncbi:hypothetical protein EW093_04445 [Thiospirochaeta perfilievii]|uniref:AMP-activated protein kinase glycogen-binding domain-containing protein n=1 Tax=Thiospirochaeta perfilievii TaxID=252967 RepID=A0A5C1QAA2_9SPIO|nr:glycogen-binding domain-containing protein [Thiospirochaeta perfilievii]QEN03980.1 hypothetical protein EW093_04445 [Thiospirochaeta perfilievii]
MMLDKIIYGITILFFLTGVAFADVTVKDLGNGQAEITFLYQDDAAEEMNVIGSFNNWIEPGDVMTKNAAGLWEFKFVTFSDDEIVYKFFDGTYISDENAPDEKDDGFAGMNGLIIVADLLLEESPATPNDPTKPVVQARKKVTFGTDTYIESDTSFNTDGDFKAVDSTINAKSVWKFDGDLVKNMPGYMELTFFDGNPTVWSDGSVEVLDGLEALSSGFIFNPAYYLSSDKKPSVDNFKFGFDTKYISYETGYGSANLPGHDSLLWETVDADGISAGDGYSAFSSKIDLESAGLTIDTKFVPNKSIGDKYGMYFDLDMTLAGLRADIQYEMTSSSTSDIQAIFENIPRQDLIIGLGYKMDKVSINTQILNSMYVAGGTTMARPAKDRVGAEVKVSYADEDLMGLDISYKLRGAVANFIYATTEDILGDEDTQGVNLSGFYKLNKAVTPKMDFSATMLNEDPLNSNIELTVKPGATFDLSEQIGKTTTGDIYVSVGLNSKPADGDKPSISVGATATMENLTINYGYNGTNADQVFNSLLLKAELENDLTAELGIGLRSGNAVINPFALCIGGSWKVPAPKAKTPLIYANFTYNMDPYETGETTATLTDYQLEDNSETEAAFRLGIVWSY